MRTAIIFYSYTGKVRRLAEKLAAKESANVIEIKDVRRPGGLKAYSAGCFAAIKGKLWPIQHYDAILGAYDHFILCFPIWAGNPPPAFNALLEKLPGGRTVSIKAVSRSGRSSCKERLRAFINAKDGVLANFEDIKV